MTSSSVSLALFFLGVACSQCGFAETSPITAAPATGISVEKPATGSAFDGLLTVPMLYDNSGNPVLQELAVIGQLQTQYAYGSDDSGKFGTMNMPDDLTWGNVEVRRFRLGLKGRMFGKVTFINLTDLHPDFSPRIYKRTPETFFTYTHSDALRFSVGKSELKFNREQEYASYEFLPFERTALGNMFYGGELTGAWVCGKDIAGGWLYYLGVYGNDRQDELPNFNGGAMILAKLGYNYTTRTSFDLAEVKFQFLHNTEPGYAESSECLKSPSYSDCVSLSNELADGPFGLTTEFLWGDGVNGKSDVCGFTAMPTYSFTKKLQWVTTFEWAGSREDNGVILPTRYEALSPGLEDKKGDAYFAGYVGANYYLDGHKLKLMSGVKYSNLDGGPDGGDFNAWTWLAGVRMIF